MFSGGIERVHWELTGYYFQRSRDPIDKTQNSIRQLIEIRESILIKS